jgi:Cu/Ag efflux pump CusA
MLNTIIRFSLRFRGAIYALALMMACYGLYTLAHSRLDVFPEFVPPMAIIQTEAPGLSSAQVEMLVTQPIESALRGTIDLQSLRSKSLQGLSVVTLVFDDSADVFRVRQLVLEKLTSLGSSLPAGVDPPKLLPLTTASSNLLVIGLTSRSRNLMDLHDTAEWTIRRQLLAVPGVADAIVFGGEPRELQIKVDPIKLLRYRLSIQEVMDAARLATLSIPTAKPLHQKP